MKAYLITTGKPLESILLACLARSFAEGKRGTPAAASSHITGDHWP
jgi:hypothetical protein